MQLDVELVCPATVHNLECYQLTLLLANDAAQMDCMKNSPYRTLEDAVITTGTSFLLLIDSEFSCAMICAYS